MEKAKNEILTSPEMLEKMQECFKKIKEFFISIGKAFKAISEKCKKWTKANFKTILQAMCSNKRVVHLALYAKRYRTRRKNINRIYKAYFKCK